VPRSLSACCPATRRFATWGWRLLLATGALIVVYLLAYTVNTFALSYGVGLGVRRSRPTRGSGA